MPDATALQERIRTMIREAEWEDLIPRLLAYASSYLAHYGQPEGRRIQKVADAYVQRAVRALLDRTEKYAPWHQGCHTAFQLLGAIIGHLIDADEVTLNQILSTTQWTVMIPKVIAHTVRKLGPRSTRHGKSPEDYVQDAVLLVLLRRRHFPHYRGVSLFTFLCHVVHGLRSNDAIRVADEGPHLTIVVKPSDDRSSGEYLEEHLPAVDFQSADDDATRAADDFLASLDGKLREYATLRALGAFNTATEYAEALHVTVQAIRNYDRQIKRRRRRWTTSPA
ncbi:MAG TPA: hypothetical protein VN605_13930, partial [Thermoanaerobaculia bacterium]|nr:hypothetical protein [Thermoanaerobaculia bacterium]